MVSTHPTGQILCTYLLAMHCIQAYLLPLIGNHFLSFFQAVLLRKFNSSAADFGFHLEQFCSKIYSCLLIKKCRCEWTSKAEKKQDDQNKVEKVWTIWTIPRDLIPTFWELGQLQSAEGFGSNCGAMVEKLQFTAVSQHADFVLNFISCWFAKCENIIKHLGYTVDDAYLGHRLLCLLRSLTLLCSGAVW